MSTSLTDRSTRVNSDAGWDQSALGADEPRSAPIRPDAGFERDPQRESAGRRHAFGNRSYKSAGRSRNAAALTLASINRWWGLSRMLAAKKILH